MCYLNQVNLNGICWVIRYLYLISQTISLFVQFNYSSMFSSRVINSFFHNSWLLGALEKSGRMQKTVQPTPKYESAANSKSMPKIMNHLLERENKIPWPSWYFEREVLDREKINQCIYEKHKTNWREEIPASAHRLDHDFRYFKRHWY